MDKVKPGDPLAKFEAETFNTMLDVNEWWKQRQLGAGRAAPLRAQHHTTVVSVLNNSGTLVDRFGVLGLDAPIITAVQNENAFAERPTFSGSTPAAGTHEGAFAVMLEPVAAGKIGKGVVSGVTVAILNVQAESDTFAEMANGSVAALTTGSSGSAQILWKAAGTGTQWGLVRLCNKVIGGGYLVKIYEKTYGTGYVLSLSSKKTNADGDDLEDTPVPTYVVGDVPAAETDAEIALTCNIKVGDIYAAFDDNEGRRTIALTAPTAFGLYVQSVTLSPLTIHYQYVDAQSLLGVGAGFDNISFLDYDRAGHDKIQIAPTAGITVGAIRQATVPEV